ncbi:MAG: hypothetical protein GXO89_05840 [Chlorobi bacterium]|nr:hypothetical protein [Chlorobiota bacterium]
MNLQKIEILIRKYESGETSMEEERALHDFFGNNEVPVHLANYKKMFSFFSASKNEMLNDEGFDERIMEAIGKEESTKSPRGKSYRLFPILGIAASILILISVGVYFQTRGPQIHFEDTYDNQELAYAETKKILMLVSGNMNTGSDELQNVAELENGFRELKKISNLKSGMKNMEKLSVLNKTKNLITTKK